MRRNCAVGDTRAVSLCVSVSIEIKLFFKNIFSAFNANIEPQCLESVVLCCNSLYADPFVGMVT